jgi:ketosteroid isomerase-like protein
MDDIVHLSFGDVPGSEYAMQLFADHLVHSWDLATGLGRSIDQDRDAVEACLRWFADREDAYRAAGAIGPRPDEPAGADPQTRLLAAFGRSTSVPDPVEIVERFNAAFNAHDVDAVMRLMSDDCTFEGTTPPDGDAYRGAAQVRAAWERLFAASPHARFEAEEIVGLGERVVVRWRYTWSDGGSDAGSDAGSGHVRGIDLFRVVDGLVAEKLSYVKG